MARAFGITPRDTLMQNATIEQYTSAGSGDSGRSINPVVAGPGDYLQVQQLLTLQVPASPNPLVAVPLTQVLSTYGTTVTPSAGNTFTLQPGYTYRCTAGCSQADGNSVQVSSSYFRWVNGSGTPTGSIATLRNLAAGNSPLDGGGIAVMYITVPTGSAEIISLSFNYVSIPGTLVILLGEDATPLNAPGLYTNETRVWGTIENIFSYALPLLGSVSAPQILQVGYGLQTTVTPTLNVSVNMPLPTVLFTSGAAISVNTLGTQFTLQPGFAYCCTAYIPETFRSTVTPAVAYYLKWVNPLGAEDGTALCVRGTGQETMMVGSASAQLFVSVPQYLAGNVLNTAKIVSLNYNFYDVSGGGTTSFIGTNVGGGVLYSNLAFANANIEVVGVVTD